jgi:SAM-dependent methyltransferase
LEYFSFTVNLLRQCSELYDRFLRHYLLPIPELRQKEVQMDIPGYSGRGLQQSREEWGARNQALTNSLNELIRNNIHVNSSRGLDLGCQEGALTDALESLPNFKWYGIDPLIKAPRLSPKGAELLPGKANELSFPNSHFDCVVFANVYEHILPEERKASFAEMFRVLTKGGVLVGQIPNPYFLIESHSRLPFMGWLPRRAQMLYWKLAPVPWPNDFYVVTMKHLKRDAEAVGFKVVLSRDFNYPAEAVPHSVRWVARLLEPVMRIIPWSWQFVFIKPE